MSFRGAFNARSTCGISRLVNGNRTFGIKVSGTAFNINMMNHTANNINSSYFSSIPNNINVDNMSTVNNSIINTTIATDLVSKMDPKAESDALLSARGLHTFSLSILDDDT